MESSGQGLYSLNLNITKTLLGRRKGGGGFSLNRPLGQYSLRVAISLFVFVSPPCVTS